MSIKELEVGQTIYYVRTKLNALSRKKIEMVDKEGVTWYRYDKEIRDYDIVEWEVIGKIRTTVEGYTGSYGPDLDEGEVVNYALASSEGTEDYIDVYYEDGEYFLTRTEAEARMSVLKEKDSEYG